MKRLILLLLLVLPVFGMSQAQTSGLVNMNVSVGFAGRFRDNMWTPVQVSLENNSTSTFNGELVIRPERSQGLTNPVSTPVSLAPDSRQIFTLYISLRSFATSVRVELMDEAGAISAEVESTVRGISTQERLFVRVSDGGQPISLREATSYAQSAAEVDWFINNIPDRGVGLEAVDLMLITNADTGSLTPQQRNALRDWVLGGGHLIVSGGASWQQTAAGLAELLPLQPSSSVLTADFGDLTRLAGVIDAPPAAESAVARGTLTDDALVLARDDEGEPLAVRRAFGYGLVDYLAFNPASAPFSRWDGLGGLWHALATSREARPGWSYGFLNLTQGYNAIEILPGVTALPEAMAMVGFLLLYIVLIGPVNYFILSRIGRREFAWFTIPALIIAFTVMAWVAGFNLRGSEVILSRLSVVESWPEADTSHVRQLIGMLSPRRANYDLNLPDSRILRPLLHTVQGGFFSNQASPVEITQTDIFSAVNFPIDASFMAGFVADGMTQTAPPISGSLTITEHANGSQSWRGSLRSDLPIPLTNAVILSRSGVVLLDEAIAAGEIRIIEEEIEAPLTAPIPAAPIEYATSFISPAQLRSVTRGRENLSGPEQSLVDIVGAANFQSSLFFGAPLQTATLDQNAQRQQAFLANFMIDQFGATARGDSVYLIGWTDAAPFDENIPGSSWRTVDTTVYITRLETSVRAATGTPDRIARDQFTWTLIEDESLSNSTPNFISYINRGRLVFQLTPVPTAVLETVDKLVLLVERGTSSLNNTEVRLLNWTTGRYDTIEITGERTEIAAPEVYLGPNNAVQVEIDRILASGALGITNIAFEQHGTRKN